MFHLQLTQQQVRDIALSSRYHVADLDHNGHAEFVRLVFSMNEHDEGTNDDE